MTEQKTFEQEVKDKDEDPAFDVGAFWAAAYFRSEIERLKKELQLYTDSFKRLEEHRDNIAARAKACDIRISLLESQNAVMRKALTFIASPTQLDEPSERDHQYIFYCEELAKNALSKLANESS